MKMLVALLLLSALSNAIVVLGNDSKEQCSHKPKLDPRPHSVSIVEFGAVGDGKTLNTGAFQNAIFYLNSFADKGGAQLYVPPGKWLTGSFNLTSHLTLFLEKDAIILGSQNPDHWGVTDPLPSYGRGIDVPGSRYRSLINGYNLSDVVITGNDGTIDGQGSYWWDSFLTHTLNHSRPNLVEIVESVGVVVSNLTFLNAPAYTIHPVYCSHVLVQNISAYSPPSSPYTIGIVPDSSDHMCIENCNISMGYDAITLKSGWDEHGIKYNRPTTCVHIKQVNLQASTGSAVAFGSEMSGGISHVLAEHLDIKNSFTGIVFRTAPGRGGYIKNIEVSSVEMENIHTAFIASGQYESHPDEEYDPSALPILEQITINNVVGVNITVAGSFTGIENTPFEFTLSEISLSLNSASTSTSAWVCSDVVGSSKSVSPEPCPELKSSSDSNSLSSSITTLSSKGSASYL
ncbi:probable polygalacturonase [Chenopodium quinoa]|uniref:probable polygalacturonase n=1 Tax=Chenopodium quinoa TaxID=63459 RepID=UPI000B78EC57|nr:probable polygalacturonase [Chenopodium quinoa]